MAKYANPDLMDAGLGYIRSNATMISICNAQPTTYAEGRTTYALGTVATGTATLTLGAGDTSGRKLTQSAATVVVGTSGTVNHIAFLTTAGSGTLLFVGTCAAQAVTAAGTLTLNSWDVDELTNPA